VEKNFRNLLDMTTSQLKIVTVRLSKEVVINIQQMNKVHISIHSHDTRDIPRVLQTKKQTNKQPNNQQQENCVM
jgi:hypothetical protein